MNNVTRVQNLQRCESLRRLDLTVNFLPPAALLSLASLRDNELLEELHLTGNPCTLWQGYRAFVIATLPQLKRLDGEQVRSAQLTHTQASFGRAACAASPAMAHTTATQALGLQQRQAAVRQLGDG